MKTLLKNSLTFLLMLMPVLAFAQQAPQIMNVSARQTTSLDGQWKTIVDPFENGYYDYRLKPYDGGYAQDKTYSDKTKLQEYDFETDKLLFVPVTGIQTMCTNTNVSPIANPARLPAPCLESVEPNTTNTKINVNTASAMNACSIIPSLNPLEPVAVGPPCEPVDTKVKRIAEPIIAPIT